MTRVSLLMSVALLVAAMVVSSVQGFGGPLAAAAAAGEATASAAAKQGVEVLQYNPVAQAGAMVTAGRVRFTVFTDRLVRIQEGVQASTLPQHLLSEEERANPAAWHFEDRATLAVVNRDLPVPKFTSGTSGSTLTIATSALKLTYQLGQPINSTSLSIVSTDSTSAFKSWAPGDRNDGNLLGTIKSLDEVGPISLNCTKVANVRVHDESLHCTWGLVSRDGWAVVDDTKSPAIDPTTGWWNVGNTTDAADMYFFGHGHDYRGALADYTLIGGKIVMIPRHANGVWWSRWYNYDNQGMKGVVEKYRSRSIPLDTYILDMDWHSKQHWGGYTIDPHLFPYPEDTWGNWLHAQGLSMGANLHDATGIYASESTFDAVCKRLGLDPSTTADIPFDIMSADYMLALEDITLQSVEDKGMDFWWIDWQQGGRTGNATGGKENPTIWLNKVRSTDNARRGSDKRDFVLARWGGLGNHRYQVGFSGDVATVNWTDLAYQPYFSLTATNVGFGFWSHDIVSNFGNDPTADQSRLEMYTRWIQWGAWSGTMRSHDRGMARGGCNRADFPELLVGCAIVEVWEVPQAYFYANRLALQDRVKHIPYIYTATRQAFDTGLSLLRPMYYDFPGFDMAYAAAPNGSFAQYMFGDDLMVAPVVVQSDSSSTLATTSIWIPPGTWIERDTGRVVTGATDGSTVQTKAFALHEVPIYVRAGAVVPTIPLLDGDTIGVASRQYTTLEWNIYPGTASGSGSVYEDDGNTTAYLKGAYAWTTASYTRGSGNALAVTVTSNGTFPARPTTRTHRFKLVNSMPLSSVMCGGKPLPYARFGGANTWTYDGPTLTAIVEVAGVAVDATLSCAFTAADVPSGGQLSGMKGCLDHARWAKDAMDETAVTPGTNNMCNAYLNVLSSSADSLSYLGGLSDLSMFNTAVANFTNLYQAAVTETSKITDQKQVRVAFANGLLAVGGCKGFEGVKELEQEREKTAHTFFSM